MPRTLLTVTPEQFVDAWASSPSVAEVARKLGYTGGLHNLYMHASKFRKKGVLLQRMRRSTVKVIDVAALNALIKGSK